MEQIASGAVNVVKDTVIGSTREYISYIGSCEENLGKLRFNLKLVSDKKNDIEKQVMIGKDQLMEITNQAGSWLEEVRKLSIDENLRSLMIKDVEIAKFVVKLMEKEDLKSFLKSDGEMRGVVVKVMNNLKKDLDGCGEVVKAHVEKDYKRVGEVMVDVMKDTTKEFLKKDIKIAATAIKLLDGEVVEKLIEGDKEMEEYVAKARLWSVEDERDQEDGVEETMPLIEPRNDKVVENNSARMSEKVKKLVRRMGDVVTPLGMKLIDDASFKKAVPEAEGIKLGVEVIQGLLLNSKGLIDHENDENNKLKRRSSCGCLGVFFCHYHNLYKISLAAQELGSRIYEQILSTCPTELVSPIRAQDLIPLPSQFNKALDSRNQLLQKIVEKLKDDQVGVIGVFGMGGTGKTTLANEVHHRAKEWFEIKVMVEVSQTPDVSRIQEEIGESIGLPLREVYSVAKKAIKLYNVLKKEEKILIILDNIWTKLDLDEFGIPRWCKILLTTREKKVCKVMGVHDANILEVGLLNQGEAKYLYKAQAGKKIDKHGYNNVVDRLLRKCGGLPLAIAATANTLKDKDLSSWSSFADELEKPIPSQVGGEHKHIYTILETSFKLFESDEKKMFFLLACLSPIGSSISVEDLLRFGIGLGLFPHVNKLSEAKERAKVWAEELVSSSMLLKGDLDGHIKIHDVVRASAISFAANDNGHNYLVDVIPRWMEDKMLRNYKGISLLSGSGNLFYSRLNGVKTDKLQILLLKGDISAEFPSSFFEGMENLEVLFLSNMNFQTVLPESIRKLKKLRTLELKGCRLGDIKWIGELVNLVVLSLRGSLLTEELGSEIGELRNLRLLDLRECKGKLSVKPSAFDRLSELEGIYMFDCTDGIQEAISCSSSYYLNSLHMNVLKLEQLPIVGNSFAEEVDEFMVSVRGRGGYAEIFSKELRCLEIDNVSITTSSLGTVNGVSVSLSGESNCLQVLLKKSGWLILRETELLENLVPELDESGFKDLRHLDLRDCCNLKFLVNTKGHQRFDLIVFPRLEILDIYRCWQLENIWQGETQNVGSMFPNLQNLVLQFLDELKFVLPQHLIPHSLTNISVSSCKSLNFIFITSAQEFQRNMNIINFPSLKSMELSSLPNLICLLGPEKSSEFSDELRGQESLFNAKMEFPALETFLAGYCANIVKLWSKEFDQRSFRNLREMTIKNCTKLTSIGPLSIFCTFERLQSLTIDSCLNMVEIIAQDETKEVDGTVQFPQLKSLLIRWCDSLETFYGGSSIVEFPKLTELKLKNLKSMKSFGGTGGSSVLFHRKIKFPCLEELEVSHISKDVEAFWDSVTEDGGGRNPVPILKKLILTSRLGLSMIPSMITQNLIYLEFQEMDEKFVFMSPIATGNNECELMENKLEKVEHLTFYRCDYLKELFQEGNYSAASTVHFCGQLKGLTLDSLPTLNILPLHLFEGLCSLLLTAMEWEYLILLDADADAGVIHKSLKQLETLKITECQNMKQVINDQAEGPDYNNLVLEFPRLKALAVSWLKSLTSFGTTSKATLRLPSLESLVVEHCEAIEYFWSGPIIASKLKEVRINCCGKIVSLFSGNATDHTLQFPSLEKITMEYCPKLGSFSSTPIVAPKLRQVKLQICYTLKWLLLGKNDLDHVQQLPSLETVEIKKCPIIQSLSSGPLRAPNLAHVIHDEKEYSRLETDDLAGLLSELPQKITRNYSTHYKNQQLKGRFSVN